MPISLRTLECLLGKPTLENRRVILSLLEVNPDAKLLDCGCGAGEITMEIARQVGTKQVWGIEIVENAAAKAEERGIKVSRGDLNEPFPFDSENFDIVHAANIIEHLYDTDMFLEEVHRVLKVGGYFLVSTCNLAALHNIFSLLLGRQPPLAQVSDKIMVGMWSSKGGPWTEYLEPRRPQHRRIFTLKALEGLLQYYGFHVEKSVGAGFYPLPLVLAGVMCKVDKRHSAYIAVKARKIANEATS